MADEEEFLPDEKGENTMLREAMDALRQGNRTRARDLLTRLLKTDQKNPTYWVWLSAAVDTQKERLYCLQMALAADPDNAAAKRGLIILGGLPPDDSIPPFPVNRPRLWEEKLTIPQEPEEKERGWANPVVRLLVILGITMVVLGGLFFGWSYLLPSNTAPDLYRTPTHRPTFTLSLTPTITPLFRTPTPTFLGPTPLWMFLDSTYTPTPLYVITEHPVTSRSAFEAGLRYLAAKDYTNALVLFEQAISLEPNAPDLYYYIGETYREEGIYRNARDAYQEAINRDPRFAPAFLGRALVNQGLNPNADIIDDLNEAISLDPNFAEAYILRGEFLVVSNPAAAKTDLETALEISTYSALAYLYLADAQLELGENDAALASATHANELDMTLIPVYLTLARAYIATGQTAQAVSVLQTYTIFAPDDTSAYLQLGTAYNAAGQFEAAVEILTKAISANRRNEEAYFQRGFAYLNLDRPQLAEDDFKLAVAYDPFDFDAQLGLARAYDQQDLPGAAYVQAEKNAYPLAKTDATKAQVYYWEAKFLEEIGDASSLQGAKNDWYQLIALPPEAMPAEWRNEAYQHLNITPTFTPTLRVTRTPTATITQTPTLLVTRTAIASGTPTP
jgi:tetratricopeptide (TPR) repeat protein